MFVFIDRRGKVVAAMLHYSDAVVYEQENIRHLYTRIDFPGLTELVDHLLLETSVGYSDKDARK